MTTPALELFVRFAAAAVLTHGGEPFRAGERRRQRRETVAGEHQFLQQRPFAKLFGQTFDAIVGERQPAQARR